MAKPTMQDQFHRDLKTVKRAARLAADYWLTHGRGVDLTDEDQRDEFMNEATEAGERLFAEGSDALHVYESTLVGLYHAKWQPGQYDALLTGGKPSKPAKQSQPETADEEIPAEFAPRWN